MLEREHVDGVGCPTGVGVGVFINAKAGCRLAAAGTRRRPPQVFHAIAKNDPMAWRPANHRSHGGMVKVASSLRRATKRSRSCPSQALR
jgi:hypothetical protein